MTKVFNSEDKGYERNMVSRQERIRNFKIEGARSTSSKKSQVWFQTKSARPEVQLPLYKIYFEIAQFNS